MTTSSETRWANAVRVLALLSIVLVTIVALEAWTLRRARAELQVLRAQREQAKGDWASSWAQEAADELDDAIRRLDQFYQEPTEGLGRPGGLCAGGTLNSRPVVDFVAGGFLRARASGEPRQAALERMKEAVQKTEAYRVAHPGPATR